MEKLVDRINRICDKQKTDKRQLWEFLKNDGPELESIISTFGGRIIRAELDDGTRPIDTPEARQYDRDKASSEARAARIEKETREIREQKNNRERNHV